MSLIKIPSPLLTVAKKTSLRSPQASKKDSLVSRQRKRIATLEDAVASAKAQDTAVKVRSGDGAERRANTVLTA